MLEKVNEVLDFLEEIRNKGLTPDAVSCGTVLSGFSNNGDLDGAYQLFRKMEQQYKAIRKHRFVKILDNPWSADLSACVDFASMRHSAEEASEDVCPWPNYSVPISWFSGSKFSLDQAESLKTGYWRLVGAGEAPFWEGPDEQELVGMSTPYLPMAIVNRKQGVPVPFQ
ncbi:hypothetical protein GH714_041583 [Hevea brasiliensis]|uniref:Protein arginine methyltransferase NDUFAF7 n=1 Tax=Hevea brasiliensis TaxID=3981 RepID=A0A6A6MQS6_HEVBR|nr:hypothetical protein GH714_041583 [Hevea brasiliensis]